MNNKTHLVVVLDRSGSMYSCAKDMEGGLRQLIVDQRKQDGECTISLYRFSSCVDKQFFFDSRYRLQLN